MSVLILCYHYTTSAFRGRDSNPDQSLEIRSNTRSLLLLLSEKRDSNPRPPPWQGGALPTELFSHLWSRWELNPPQIACKAFSPALVHAAPYCGSDGTWTRILLVANETLSQLSYTPRFERMKGIEPSSEHWKCPVMPLYDIRVLYR